jgi:hypothetical protein
MSNQLTGEKRTLLLPRKRPRRVSYSRTSSSYTGLSLSVLCGFGWMTRLSGRLRQSPSGLFMHPNRLMPAGMRVIANIGFPLVSGNWSFVDRP